jgi:acetyl esterase/lipase
MNINFSRLPVAGDSVSGKMATALSLLAKERGGHKITFEMLFYPVTDANFDTPSYMAYQEDIG